MANYSTNIVVAPIHSIPTSVYNTSSVLNSRIIGVVGSYIYDTTQELSHSVPVLISTTSISGIFTTTSTTTTSTTTTTTTTIIPTTTTTTTSTTTTLVPNVVKYGILYNWYALDDARNIANIGWHVCTYTEISDLSTSLGGDTVSGGKLKEVGLTHWQAPNVGTDDVGFKMVGSTGRHGNDGTFDDVSWLGVWGRLWTGTSVNSTQAWMFQTRNSLTSLSIVYTYIGGKKSGLSVRLVKDSTDLEDGEEGTYIGNNGRIYKTICIGTTEWLQDNLVETKYRNGNLIPEVTDDATWAALTTGALCAYNNDWGYVYE